MLNSRQLKILQLIIDDFIASGAPVGSRTISKKSALGISSATVRNEMADLEELGYLYQPHTSAGRIPSDQGYRIYVDSLSLDKAIGQREKNLIRSLLISGKIRAEEVIENAAHLIAEITGLVVVASYPGFKKHSLSNLKLIKISETKVLLILISDNEVVKNLTLSFSGTTQSILDEISNALLRNLEGSTIEDITVKKISKLKYDLKNYAEVIDYLVPILRDTMKNIDEVEYRVEGFDNILSVPEFSDGTKARRMYQLFENKTIFKDIFDQITAEGIDIRIGEENEVEELRECSLITTTYRYQARDFGKIAVIGPKRMDYRGIISTLEYVSNTLSDIFSGIYL
ncbi:MAG: hypothetical protein AVO33_00090 [delta proteobacterium ML8_F1]|nr:MAG: hypothetical protein AVO33_00090 [delta proteobacterium ML8_F1]